MVKKQQHGESRPGSGRPVASPEGRTVTVAASVPESLAGSLDAYARDKGLNRSKAVTEAIRGLVRKKRRS